jgi:hypothetical protein
MEWKFEEITPQTTKVDPSHLEFFSNEALGDTVQALVREDIQNKLDAKQKGFDGPVRVRYHFSGRKDWLLEEQKAEWMKGLYEHLNAENCLEELNLLVVKAQTPLHFLVIEDFNTTGLRGNPLTTMDPVGEAERNDFYWFIRNVGRTGKKAGDRGRWGLGKIVYPASSVLRSFFCYSVREKGQEPILIGRSVLAIHNISGKEYQSEGYFAEFPDATYDCFAHPSSDESKIERFRSIFKIARTEDQPGLSLVIPAPVPNISFRGLVNAVIQNYFMEILRGNLEVEVSRDDTIAVINESTIDDVVVSFLGASEEESRRIRERIRFTRETFLLDSGSPDCFFCLRPPAASGKDELGDLFESQERLDQAKKLYRSGTTIALKLEVDIVKTANPENVVSTYFMVYLQRSESLGRADETFIRDGLTIIGEGQIRDQGVRALVLAEDHAMTEFLGDAENPAHTKWDNKTKHFRGKYKKGKMLLDYVRKSAAGLSTLLGRVENELLEDLLDDLFGIPEPLGKDAEDRVNPRKRGRKKPPKGGVARKRYLQTSRLEADAGFSVKLSPDAFGRPSRIVIRAAYEPDQGDPFSQYHPADFNFSDSSGSVIVETQNVQETARGPNRMVFEPTNDDFLIRVTGFDRNRDLRIDVRPENDREESVVE